MSCTSHRTAVGDKKIRPRELKLAVNNLDATLYHTRSLISRIFSSNLEIVDVLSFILLGNFQVEHTKTSRSYSCHI